MNTFGTVNLLEAIEQMTGNKLDWRYVEETRKGNHTCYISNPQKFRKHYWNREIRNHAGLDAILKEAIIRRAPGNSAVPAM